MRMCDSFLTRGMAVPRGPALNRRRLEPFSTRARWTVNWSAVRLTFGLFSALAIALFNVLSRRRADLRGISVSRSTATVTLRPWIWRATSRTFFGDMRVLRVTAWTSMVGLLGWAAGRAHSSL